MSRESNLLTEEPATATDDTNADTLQSRHSYCNLPPVAERLLPANVDLGRAFLIRDNAKKWLNGTVLHYYFFDRPTDGSSVLLTNGTTEWRPWTTGEAEKDLVRRAFETWKDLGIGLELREVASRDEAEVRIGFLRSDGAWSYIGRDILGIGRDDRTMNFGWDLMRPGEIDTALHEIGHTLGFPHAHQNPFSGIEWNEEAVYAALAAPPNRWSRETTYYNILRKLTPNAVLGSVWDENSIMQYPFEAGLIDKPVHYRAGLSPTPGLSERDIAWVRAFYPPITEDDHLRLEPFQSIPLAVLPGEQSNFVLEPSTTRTYDIRTFGKSDTVMALFEDAQGDPRYLTADDDSGEDRNASLQVKLFQGRRYLLRVRLYYQDRSGETAVMMW